MGWFFNKPERPPFEGTAANLYDALRQHMPGADDATVRVATSIAGLLAGVAHADRAYTDDEELHVREVISSVRGIHPSGVGAICSALRQLGPELAAVHSHAFTRQLKQLADRDTRLDVLDVLVDLAAADDEISGAETIYLRRVATSLGLTQHDYNASQQRHRDKLALLRGVGPS